MKIYKSDTYREYLRIKRNVGRYPSLQILLDHWPDDGVDPEVTVVHDVKALHSLMKDLIHMRYDFAVFTDSETKKFVQIAFDDGDMILDIPDLMPNSYGFRDLLEEVEKRGLELHDRLEAYQVEMAKDTLLASELVIFCLDRLYGRKKKGAIKVEVG